MQREEFADLVALHQPALSRFASRYLRSREDADEVVQESFLRAWAQIQRFKPGSNFAAWLMTITRFLCLARLKETRRRRPAALPDLAAPGVPDDLEPLRQACASLPLAQREIVALRYFDDLDYRSIAEITGEPETALRSRLHDALERLRELLAKDF